MSSNLVFEVIDKTGRKVYLTLERLKHIQRHSHMHDSVEFIKDTLQNPTTIRYEHDKDNLYFYREFTRISPNKRYLLVAVNYLNSKGFVITSFFTDRITGEIWKRK